MVILKQELRQGRSTLVLWAAIIAFMLGICILIYPEMETQMADIGGMFSEMGSFSAAFGMDKINFGEFTGFFCVECGNVLGLGGSFFAALLGISSLAKEERDKTAEFLLTHPVNREKIVTQKLCAIFLQIILLNIVVIAVTTVSSSVIGETLKFKTAVLIFLAYFIMQIETASICFGISAFLSRAGMGIGLGIAAMFYFLNIIANLTEGAKFLKYLTPFGYTEGADIVANGSINAGYLAVGIIFTVAGIIAAFVKYIKKDIV